MAACTCAEMFGWPAIHINDERHATTKSLAQDWLRISEVTYERQSELGSYRVLPWTSIVIWPILSSPQSLSHICLCKSSSVEWVCADSHHSFWDLKILSHYTSKCLPRTRSMDPSLELWGRRLLSSLAVWILYSFWLKWMSRFVSIVHFLLQWFFIFRSYRT